MSGEMNTAEDLLLDILREARANNGQLSEQSKSRMETWAQAIAEPTPFPWRVEAHSSGTIFIVAGEGISDRVIVARVESCRDGSDTSLHPDPEESVANAHLIEAMCRICEGFTAKQLNSAPGLEYVMRELATSVDLIKRASGAPLHPSSLDPINTISNIIQQFIEKP